MNGKKLTLLSLEKEVKGELQKLKSEIKILDETYDKTDKAHEKNFYHLDNKIADVNKRLDKTTLLSLKLAKFVKPASIILSGLFVVTIISVFVFGLYIQKEIFKINKEVSQLAKVLKRHQNLTNLVVKQTNSELADTTRVINTAIIELQCRLGAISRTKCEAYEFKRYNIYRRK